MTMKGRPSRPLVVLATGIVVVAALVASTLSLTGMPVASAQDGLPFPGGAIQTPPSLPGLDDTIGAPGASSSTAPALTAATPAPPVDTATTMTPGAPVQGGTVTASLGGSDVAVSSVGGSNEVDAPKRRAKRGNRD
jgi:hypothetical protein